MEKKYFNEPGSGSGQNSKPVFTIEEFCFAHGGISRAFFYKLVKQGQGPRLLKLGTRTLITAEAAAEWRHEMEIRTAEASAP